MAEIPASLRVVRAEELLEEHRALHGHLERIEGAASVPPVLSAAEPWLSQLASQLADLLPLLEAHFAREEDGRLFDEIQEAWPNAAHTCERLRREHPELLSAFGRLRDRAAEPVSSPEALLALAAEARSVCRALARHEDVENELLCRSLDDAVAAQD